MKINHEQLQAQLNKKLVPLYWVQGDELLLRQETCAAITKAAQQQGYLERQVYSVDANFSWEDLALELQSLSLFSTRGLIELQCHDIKFKDFAKTLLLQQSQQNDPVKYIIISSPKLETKFQSTPWFEQLSQQALIIAVWPIALPQLPQWIIQRLKAQGLSADNAGIQLLAERTEGNLLATQQAITKLQLTFGSGHITTAQIDECSVDQAQYDIFTAVDCALNGDVTRVITILNHLEVTAGEPHLLLWAVTREIRQLLLIVKEIQTGITLANALNKAKVWEKRKPIYSRAAQRHSISSLQQLLLRAMQIDLIIKGAKRGLLWDSLRQTYCQLAGKTPITEIL